MTWAPDYVTASELKSYLRIDDTADDVFIGLWVTTVSRNVDDHCGRQFGQVDTPESRTYEGVWNRDLGLYVAEIDDLMDLTGLAWEDEAGVEVTDYELWPRNAQQKGKPYTQIRTSTAGWLVGVAPWGWSAIPSSVKTGIFLQGARLAARRDSPFGISGSPSEQGEIRLLAQLDPDFRTSLKPFVRKWWAA